MDRYPAERCTMFVGILAALKSKSGRKENSWTQSLLNVFDSCSFNTCYYPLGKFGSAGVERPSLWQVWRCVLLRSRAVCGCRGDGGLPSDMSRELASCLLLMEGLTPSGCSPSLQPGWWGGGRMCSRRQRGESGDLKRPESWERGRRGVKRKSVERRKESCENQRRQMKAREDQDVLWPSPADKSHFY